MRYHRITKKAGFFVSHNFFLSYNKRSPAFNAIHEQAHGRLMGFQFLPCFQAHERDPHFGFVRKHLPADLVRIELDKFLKVKSFHESLLFDYYPTGCRGAL